MPKPYKHCPDCGAEGQYIDASWTKERMAESYVCPKCRAGWSEYFSLTHTGFIADWDKEKDTYKRY